MTKKFLTYLAPCLLTITGLTSCSNTNDDDSPYISGPAESTVLIYAVATNSLSSNLISDKREMVYAAKNIDLTRNKVLLYEATYTNAPRLLSLTATKEGTYDFEVIKEYSQEVSSVDPERISEVMTDVAEISPSDLYGLVLWSHGTGWIPYFQDSASGASKVAMYSFGYDRDPDNNKIHYEINIDDLADAIPSHFFSYIWFDACYMGNIETVYELRDKCDYFIGYPTEVFEFGVPYDTVLPYLTRKNPDYSQAAETFFDYYALHPNPDARVATVAVLDMTAIEDVADLCKVAYSFEGIPNPGSLQKYSRGVIGPYYDLGEYTKAKANMMQTPNEDFMEEFNAAMDRFVIFKRTTSVDFNMNILDPDKYSGLSCHLFNPNVDSENQRYYKSLDWYKRTYSGSN